MTGSVEDSPVEPLDSPAADKSTNTVDDELAAAAESENVPTKCEAEPTVNEDMEERRVVRATADNSRSNGSTEARWAVGVIGCTNGFEARTLFGNIMVQVGSAKPTALRSATDRASLWLTTHDASVETLEPPSQIHTALVDGSATRFHVFRRRHLHQYPIFVLTGYRYAREIGGKRTGSYLGAFVMSESPSFHCGQALKVIDSIMERLLEVTPPSTPGGTPQFSHSLADMLRAGVFEGCIDLKLAESASSDPPTSRISSYPALRKLWGPSALVLPMHGPITPSTLRIGASLGLRYSAMIWADDGNVQRATGAPEAYTEDDLLRYKDHKSVSALVADHKTAEDTSCGPQAENFGPALGGGVTPPTNPNSTEIELKHGTSLANPIIAALKPGVGTDRPASPVDAPPYDGSSLLGAISPAAPKSDGVDAKGATPKQGAFNPEPTSPDDQTSSIKGTLPEPAKALKPDPDKVHVPQASVGANIYDDATKWFEANIADLKLKAPKEAGQTKFSEWIEKYRWRIICYGFPLCMTTFFGLGYFVAHSNPSREPAGASAAAQPLNPANANKIQAAGTSPAKRCENPSELAIFKIKEIAVGISPPTQAAIVKYIDENCFSEMSEECEVSARQQVNSELDAVRYIISPLSDRSPLPIQVALPSHCAAKLADARAGTGSIISVEMSGQLRAAGSAVAPFRRESFSKLEELVAMPSTSRLQIDVEVPKGCAGNICQSSQAELERIILASIQTFSGRPVSAKVTFVQAGNVGSKWLWRAQAFN